MSNRKARVRSSSRSSAGVSRSKRSVPRPAACRATATCLLRELCRELPLPCAKTTTPRPPGGTTRSPSMAPLSTERRTAAPRDEQADLLVRDRGEVLVVQPDRVEIAVLPETEHVVDLGAQLVGGLRRADRHRDYETLRLVAADRSHGRRGGRAGGEPVVDDDRGTPAHRHRRQPPAMALGELRQLGGLARRGV